MFNLRISLKVLLFLFTAALLATSCSKDDDNEDEYQTENAQNAFQLITKNATLAHDSLDMGDEDYEDGLDDLGDCFTIVYPIDIAFPDGSTQTAADDAELEAIIETWIEQNPDSPDFPSPVFPIDVVIDSTETVSVANDEDFCTLIEQCEGFDDDYDDYDDEEDYEDGEHDEDEEGDEDEDEMDDDEDMDDDMDDMDDEETEDDDTDGEG